MQNDFRSLLAESLPQGEIYCHAENKFKPVYKFRKNPKQWISEDASFRSVYRAVCNDCLRRGYTLDVVYPRAGARKLDIKY